MDPAAPDGTGRPEPAAAWPPLAPAPDLSGAAPSDPAPTAQAPSVQSPEPQVAPTAPPAPPTADAAAGQRRVQVYRVYRWSDEQQQRYEHMSRQVIDFLAGDPEGSALVRRFRLTRDRAVDHGQRRQLEDLLRQKWLELQLPIRAEEVGPVIDLAYDELIGLGPLGVLWRDDNVTDILVDSWDRVVVEYNGRLMETTARFHNAEHANSIARNMARLISDRALSPTNPLVTAQLDGARVNFAYAPVAASGLVISMRKARPLMGMRGLVENGSLTPEMAEFLRDAVRARATTLVSGGTGVGKTTMINALSESIPDDERVVTIEDALELKLANRFVVSLQTKEAASRDDDALVDQSQLLVNCLRMRPDRIIVGEIREASAAMEMLRAANTGHDGTMTTIHANNVDAALNNTLANLVRAASGVPDDIVKQQIADAIDVVVQGTRRRGLRFIEQIAEVTDDGLDTGRLQPLVVFRGKVTAEGTVEHERVGGIQVDGLLAEKMYEAGIDPTRWY